MSVKVKNEYGTILIENEVVACIAGNAAMDCYGVVGMAARDVKDGIFQLLKRESLTKGIQLNVADGSLMIDLHIIVEYETNIPAIAESLISTVKYKVETFVGIEVEKINIYVEGLRV